MKIMRLIHHASKPFPGNGFCFQTASENNVSSCHNISPSRFHSPKWFPYWTSHPVPTRGRGSAAQPPPPRAECSTTHRKHSEPPPHGERHCLWPLCNSVPGGALKRSSPHQAGRAKGEQLSTALLALKPRMSFSTETCRTWWVLSKCLQRNPVGCLPSPLLPLS